MDDTYTVTAGNNTLLPMAERWQMPFASSRGYGSLKLQHDVAEMIGQRRAQTGQLAVVSPHPSAATPLVPVTNFVRTYFGRKGR
jgi:hypothetical protein